MATHYVSGKTNAETTANFRQALMLAVDGDVIELGYGVECLGPFLIWSRIEIVGQDPGAHTLYAPTSPVLSVGSAGVVIRKIAIHYTGTGEGIALQSPPNVKPDLVDVDIIGQVVYGSTRPPDHRPQPVTRTQLNFGTIERPETAPHLSLPIQNVGRVDWHYAVHSEAWLDVTPAAGVLRPNEEHTLQVGLNASATTLPDNRWLDFPTGVQVYGNDVTLDVPVRIFYLPPPPPKLSRIVIDNHTALQVDVSPVVFRAGSSWKQHPTVRTIHNESSTPWQGTVAAPGWLSVFPLAFTIAPKETISLMIQPIPSLKPQPKVYTGIIALRDHMNTPTAMIAASFDYREPGM